MSRNSVYFVLKTYLDTCFFRLCKNFSKLNCFSSFFKRSKLALFTLNMEKWSIFDIKIRISRQRNWNTKKHILQLFLGDKWNIFSEKFLEIHLAPPSTHLFENKRIFKRKIRANKDAKKFFSIFSNILC